MKLERRAVPEWALDYLVNGTLDDLEPGEQEMIDEWLQRNNILDVWPAEEESYFTPCPPFGLACNVVECDCVTE